MEINMNLIYGVDSKKPANTLLTNGYDFYHWVMRMSCYPSFWGRTLLGEGEITKDEIKFFKEKKCRIALIVRNLKEAKIATNSAVEEVNEIVKSAKKLGVPQNQKIAIFAEIPPDWHVNHNWMISYGRHLLENGYYPGFIGNTDSSKNFCFGRQCSHYVQATRKDNQLNAVYCSTEPKYNFEPDNWVPYAPSQLLPRDMHMWQYGTIDFHSIHANKYYANADMVANCFWKV